MKKVYFILAASLVLLLLILFLFYPRRVEHAIFLDVNQKESRFYINTRIRGFRTPQLGLKKYSVVDFKYNIFMAYGFKEVRPFEERVMVKTPGSYELEKSGFFHLSKNPNFYSIDSSDKISCSSSDRLIVGKYNVKSYSDRKGKLKTFILTPMDYSEMRVAISATNFQSLYHNSLKIISSSPVKLFSLREKFSSTVPSDSNIQIDISDNKLNIVTRDFSAHFNSRVYIQGNSMCISTITRGIPSFIPSYGGVLELTLSDQGILAINEVNLESYLSKVVPSEMPASSAPEALKCQAIAARTYAISDMLGNRYASLGFYVDDSTQSQVYNNIPVQESSTDAVNSTKGIVMTYKGIPIDAKYYSTSAGTGVNYSDIWFRSDGSSDDRPYLRTSNYLTEDNNLPSSEAEWLSFYKDTELKAIDSVSPYFRWSINYPQSALTQALNKSLRIIFEKHRDYMIIRKDDKIIDRLPELKKLNDIRILKRSTGGNIIQISFIFDDVSVDVSSDYYIRSAIRCSKEFAGIPISIIRHKGRPLTNNNFLPSSFFSVEKVDDIFTIYGGGYGHGVGMSQFGAMELGRAGKSYTDILNTFYKDITIENLY